MPQVMTEEEAIEKTCPFMSYRGEDRTECLGSGCACWGWVDGEEGQLSTKIDDVDVRTTDSAHQADEWSDQGWFFAGADLDGDGKYVMKRGKVIGPRRGYCGIAFKL